MNISTKNLDEDQFLTLVAQLRLHGAQCRALLVNKTGEVVQAPTIPDDYFEAVDVLTAHITELEAKLGSSAPAFQFSAGRVVHTTGVATRRLQSAPAEKSSATPAQSLTAKVLAARGVTTLAELATKREQNSIHDND